MVAVAFYLKNPWTSRGKGLLNGMNSNTDDIPNKDDVPGGGGLRTFLIGIGIAAVVVFWLIVPYAVIWLTWNPNERDFSAASQIGSVFGSVNALFAGLGLFAVSATLLLQRRQLSLQAVQLNTQAKDTKKTHQFLKEQGNLMRVSALLSALPVLIEQAGRTLRRCLSELNHHRQNNFLDPEDLERCVSELAGMNSATEEEFKSRRRNGNVPYDLYAEGNYVLFNRRARLAFLAAENADLLSKKLNALNVHLES